ncbi:MAG: AsnC family protein [Flavobacteriales bacterium]
MDKKILNLLIEDTNTTMFELSKIIVISNVAVHQRIKNYVHQTL